MTVGGLLPVAEHGCGYRSHLVVKGPATGQVWGDWTCVGEAPAPEAKSFGTWYHDWLESSLREVPGERIKATVHDETGWSVDRRLLGLLPPPPAGGGAQPEVRALRLLCGSTPPSANAATAMPATSSPKPAPSALRRTTRWASRLRTPCSRARKARSPTP